MSSSLQVAGFLDNSLVNGKGLRSVLFLSGCRHNCMGCHNKPMQDFNYGDTVELEEIMIRINKNIPLIKGVTFSGGEPLEQAENLVKLASIIKSENLNIWCYTGYVFEDILSKMAENPILKKLMSYIDVIIDGKFDENKKGCNLKYRGSSNQRIIDVKQSLTNNRVVLYNI